MSPADETPEGYTWPAAPAPVTGCLDCANLNTRRRHAHTAGDRAAETDANVLMRTHQRLAHESVASRQPNG